jgi:hypothetical protein
MKSARVLLLIAFIGCMPAAALAAVVTFDDVPPGPVPAGYEGLTWGTSSDDAVPGFTGYFSVSGDASYATPHSAPNYVYNAWGPNNLWFSFASPVISFTGAWFARAVGASDDYEADRVRLRDDLGNVSAWLDLTVAPQFLSAGFLGSTTVYVERAGGVGGTTGGNARWYTMDDVTYEPVPEPATMLLVGGGLLGLYARRRRAT